MLVVNEIICRLAIRIENVLAYVTFAIGLKQNMSKEKNTFYLDKRLDIVSPINAGLWTTLIPALSRAKILELKSYFFYEIIALVWLIRRPILLVCWEMKLTTGKFR